MRSLADICIEKRGLEYVVPGAISAGIVRTV